MGGRAPGAPPLDLPLEKVNKNNYRPQRMFLQACVILFTGGVSASVHAEIPPQEQTPPQSRHPPRSRHPLPREHAGIPPGADTPPPGADPSGSRHQRTVDERPVRILLECVLVVIVFTTSFKLTQLVKFDFDLL